MAAPSRRKKSLVLLALLARKKPEAKSPQSRIESTVNRCINLDWLECYCHEDDIGYPHDAEYFRRAGFHVEEREYGTPVYHEMFTIYDNFNNPLIEVRRNPKSAIGRQVHGVLDHMSTHVRLHNRTCYFNSPVKLITQFLEQYGFHFQRISRIDLALDFEKFDYGDDPREFIRRYMAGRYAKINQANITSHGRDRWLNRDWTSISWGDPKSMIGTKLYLKTKELAERKDKPYIRQAWRAAGLVDDDETLEKFRPDGTAYKPDIWRVEFSIKSSTRKWFIIEDFRGEKKKIRSIPHTLDMYDTKQKMLDMFFSLTDHYFHFKKAKEGVRKDRCEDKLLFRTDDVATFYKLESVHTIVEKNKAIERLISHLITYRDAHCTPDIYKACNVIIKQLMQEQTMAHLQHPLPREEVELMRLLISKRIKSHDAPLSQDIAEIRTMLAINNDLFGDYD